MVREYFKKVMLIVKSDVIEIKKIVCEILDDIEVGGDEVVLKYVVKFD